MAKLFVVLYVVLLHFIGIYLFTSGFLLTRLALDDTSVEGRIEPQYKRAIILVIDALRFDFIAPNPESNAAHHNVLTLPSSFTQSSFIFNAHADPPTTTMQRIKALMTGSLPTFVDLSMNFAKGGNEQGEDSLLGQVRRAGGKAAFMGDDTWLNVFPSSFETNMSFPFDSFNVEDLHTVDEGVIRHLFPLLTENPPWQFLVGHFLGVDHVGHRLGPEHPLMSQKLKQMNEVLEKVVESIDKDTLLVVMGDHGMDATGDHGGDGELETSSGLWIYSKKLSTTTPDIPDPLRPRKTFPGMTAPYRAVQQIDLVPTLSLLLGLPIPFNNLGTVIPELFPTLPLLAKALEINARQIKEYLARYRQESGTEWDALADEWEESLQLTEEDKVMRLYEFNRRALESCRAMWARFDSTLMIMGLMVIFASILSIHSLIQAQESIYQGLRGFAGGALLGFMGASASGNKAAALDWVLFGAALCSALMTFLRGVPKLPTLTFETLVPVIIIVLHTLSFLSNSFTFWEDRITLFLFCSSLLPFLRSGLQAPTPKARRRILGLVGIAALSARLMAASTVCREEQGGYCHVTFYAGASLPTPPAAILLLAVPVALALPSGISWLNGDTVTHSVTSRVFVQWLWRAILLASAGIWLLEWVDASNSFRQARTVLANVAFILGGFGGAAVSYYTGHKLISLLFTFGLVYASNQMTGQVVLALSLVAAFSIWEAGKTIRDVAYLREAFSSNQLTQLSSLPLSSPGISEIVPLVVLSILGFFATGHQATVSSMQWRSAFLLTANADYFWSPLTVGLNTLGVIMVLAGIGPLALSPRVDIQDSIRRALLPQLYFTCLLFGTSLSAAVLRRHLMVWKVFAPRWILAVASVVSVDLGVLIGIL